MKLLTSGFTCFMISCITLSGSSFALEAGAVHDYNGEITKDKVYKDAVYKDAVYKDAVVVSEDHFEIIGGPGIAKLKAGDSTIGVTSSEVDKLVQTNSSSWNTLALQLGLGYVGYFGQSQQYSDSVQWFPSYEPELNLYYLGTNSIEGDVWRFGNPAYNQLTYDIPVHSTRLMFDMALTVFSWKAVSLYGIAGLGNAWTRISYSDVSNSDADCINQQVSLDSKTRSQFAWEAGAGLGYAFNQNYGLTLEYLYADLGNVKTAATGSTGTITTPVTSAAQFGLKSQSVLLNLHVAL